MKILEHVSWDSTSQIDETNGIVRGVKIIGLKSDNGRRYKKEALQEAASLYEGVGVNLDHRDEDSRRVSDGFGRAINVEMREDGLYGDLEYLTTHPYASQFVEAAKRMPEQLGLSHSAFGEVKREGDGEIVETIHRVRSVDVVRYPASTKGLYENQRAMEEVLDGSPRFHFRAAIMSILDDSSLSKDEVGRKIMTILKAEEKVFGKPEEGEVTPGIPESKNEEGGDDSKKLLEAVNALREEATATREKLQEVSESYHSATRRVEVLECCIAHRVKMSDVPSEDMKKLQEQETRDDMDKLVEGWPASLKHVEKPAMPPVGGGEYEKIREEMSTVYGFKK